MKKKKFQFSIPLNYYWKDVYGIQKKITPYFSDEIIFTILRQNIIRTPLEQGETLEKRDLIVSGLELWYKDVQGKFLHIYFLENQLQTFLETTSLSDLDGLREYLIKNGEISKITFTTNYKNQSCVNYTFGLHIPNETEGYAFSLYLYENNSIELYFNHGKNSGRTTDKLYNSTNKSNDPKVLEINKMFRLAINTIAYIKCFPECVTDGPPDICNDTEKNEAKRISIKLSNDVIDVEKSRATIIPHFRKGHFKLLKSDFYTHKKGQLIYIAETMVKAKAKTVSTSDRLEDFN